MKVISTYNHVVNDCTMDCLCEFCGHIDVDKSAYNDDNYINNVVPERKCPSCGKSVIEHKDDLIKKPYGKIEFNGCYLEYDHTICEWRDIKFEIEAAESSFEQYDPNTEDEYGFPTIKITPVMLTEAEYKQIQKEQEENA